MGKEGDWGAVQLRTSLWEGEEYELEKSGRGKDEQPCRLLYNAREKGLVKYNNLGKSPSPAAS